MGAADPDHVVSETTGAKAFPGLAERERPAREPMLVHQQPRHSRDAVQPLRTARPVGPGRAVPGPRERPPPRPEQYGAVPHIDSGILPRCPSIVRRYGLPLCTGRGTSSYAVNEASRSPIGPGALQAPGHPRAAAAALLRCCWRGPGPGPAAPPPGEAARAGAADPGPFAHRPAAVVIGTAAVKTVLPETLAKWQRVVDLTARLARVPASLIMRTERPKHTVLVSSRTEGNPYDVGREYDLNALLYCQGVFDNDGELVVEDATHDPVWAGNEDLADGMRFYIGYPLKWPSGEVFGTICVLDRERNDHALLFREGLQAFAGVVEANLRSLVELAERRRLETALQHSLDQTARQVVERTSELQDANTALRVLLGNVEKSHEARNEQMLQQINTLVMPHVAKLARRVERDSAAVEYVSLIETNLTTLTSSLSSRMARVFQALTATEADVAHLVMRGLTTKDIAATLSRAPSTIDFHRNNIRAKLGVERRVTLRAHLLSIR